MKSPAFNCYTPTLVAFLTLLLLSCGYDPNQKVYDYANNPDAFPTQAVAVLRGIDTDSIVGYSGIVASFGQLYSTRPDLLDNADWQTVIQRLGARFRYKADQLVLAGPAKFSEAADLYTLAAFARPNDIRSTEQRDIFETWTRAIEDSLVKLSDWQSEKVPSLKTRLQAAKAFVLDDSLAGAFAKKYLVPRLFFSSTNLNVLNLQPYDSLTDGDRAFANFLGLNVRPPKSRLAAFTHPSVELNAAEILPAGPGMFRAALYFTPREKIDSTLTVALRLKGTDPTASGAGEVNLDFQPAVPSNHWKVGKLQVCFRKFQFHSTVVEAAVGLYDNAAATPRFADIEGTGVRLFPLPLPNLLTNH